MDRFTRRQALGRGATTTVAVVALATTQSAGVAWAGLPAQAGSHTDFHALVEAVGLAPQPIGSAVNVEATTTRFALRYDQLSAREQAFTDEVLDVLSALSGKRFAEVSAEVRLDVLRRKGKLREGERFPLSRERIVEITEVSSSLDLVSGALDDSPVLTHLRPVSL